MKTPHSAEQPVVLGGTYSEDRPIAALRQYFRCAWNHQVSANFAGNMQIVPDGCVDLLCTEEGFFVVGPDITAARPEVSPGSTVLGLRFQPGAAAGWLGLSMAEIVGCRVDMGDLWGAVAREIFGRMHEAGGTQDRLSLFQTLVEQLAPIKLAPSPEAALAFRRLERASECNVDALFVLRKELGLDERTLRRKSVHHFGYGLKTLERILRFQRFSALSRSDRQAGLAELSLASGYADQAHLSREIRSLCGVSAGAYLRQTRG